MVHENCFGKMLEIVQSLKIMRLKNFGAIQWLQTKIEYTSFSVEYSYMYMYIMYPSLVGPDIDVGGKSSH